MSGTGRERVVRVYDPRGVLCLAFMWGVVLGLVIPRAESYLGLRLSPSQQWWKPVIVLHLVLGVHVGFAAMLSRVTGRIRLVVLAAVTINLGVFVAAILDSLVSAVGFGAGWQGTVFPWQAGVAIVITSSIAACAALIARWVFRSVRYVPIEQTDPPRLCPACAYEMGDADPCPECGQCMLRARARGVWLDRLWMLLQRAGRPLLILVVVVFASYAGWRVVCDYIPTRRFFAQFAEGDNATYSYIDHYHGLGYNSAAYINSLGRTIDLNDGTSRMILISFRALVPDGLPPMQVRLCAPATPPGGWPAGAQRMTDWGAPGTIVADLSREQAERVLREGLPPGLIDAIVARADEVGWKPWGGMNSGPGGKRETIDAGPFFAEQVPERE